MMQFSSMWQCLQIVALLAAACVHGVSAVGALRGGVITGRMLGASIDRFMWYPSNSQGSFQWNTAGLSIARPIVMIPWYQDGVDPHNLACTTISQTKISDIVTQFCKSMGKCEVFMVPQTPFSGTTVAQQVKIMQGCLSGIPHSPKVTGLMGDTEIYHGPTAKDLQTYWTAAKSLSPKLETGYIKGGLSATADPALDVNAVEFYGPVSGTCTPWGAAPTCVFGHSSSNCYTADGNVYGAEAVKVMNNKNPANNFPANAKVTAFAGGCGASGCTTGTFSADCALEYSQLPSAINTYFASKGPQASNDFGVFS